MEVTYSANPGDAMTWLKGRVGVMGKRWNNPDLLAEQAEEEGAPEVVRFWQSPVFGERFCDVPAFLLPRLAKMATEVPNTDLGLRIYYERVHCLIVLAHIARRTDPASFDLTEPPASAERDLGLALGQAFHQGCPARGHRARCRAPARSGRRDREADNPSHQVAQPDSGRP
jgi:hypothetical protein